MGGMVGECCVDIFVLGHVVLLFCSVLKTWPVGSIRVFVYIICCIVHYLVSVLLFVFVVVFVPCDCVIVLLLMFVLLFLSFR